MADVVVYQMDKKKVIINYQPKLSLCVGSTAIGGGGLLGAGLDHNVAHCSMLD